MTISPVRSNAYAVIAIALLVAVLVFLCLTLTRQYRMISREQQISGERQHFATLLHHPLGASDTGLIQSWMTFDYVSVSFKVPLADIASALKLASSTPGYPNITVARYSRLNATSSDAVVQEIRDAVRTYLMTPPAGTHT